MTNDQLKRVIASSKHLAEIENRKETLYEVYFRYGLMLTVEHIWEPADDGLTSMDTGDGRILVVVEDIIAVKLLAAE